MPKSYLVLFSQRRFWAVWLIFMPEAPLYGVPAPTSDMAAQFPMPFMEPVWPALTRNLRSVTTGFCGKNFSLETSQAREPAGKKPNRLFTGKRDDPSALKERFRM